MKCITKPKQPEEAIYYSDFSGKLFKDFIPVTVNVKCEYGSQYDGAHVEFHLSDKGLEHLLSFLKTHLCEETKAEFKRLSQSDDNNKHFYQKLK
jgi:hypothetical protein